MINFALLTKDGSVGPIGVLDPQDFSSRQIELHALDDSLGARLSLHNLFQALRRRR